MGRKGIEIDEQVDASICKGRHAALVVAIWIHVVHSDGVGAQLGHAHDIALALGSVDKRIVGSQLIGDTCPDQLVTRIFRGNAMRELPKHTLEVVLCAILVEELGSDRRNGWNGAHRRSL